jgi:hypothetical protein
VNTVDDGKTLIDRKQAMEILGLKPAHFSKVCNGRIKGLKPLPCVRIGRRLLFIRETVWQFARDNEAATCSADR